ncbi:structural protein [Serratia phage BF]|uniref:Structural protein n=2 Tax=Eneladusvirus BF TaxID=2560751 RepID=A0A1S6UAC2_9CAUD|nr:structural protein [Serratia phage BF]AQW88686.1 structural protein [Serratia phage BF]QOI71644.1 putative structural protein [Erwinia phage pEa_SNUABM_47]QXO11857.1 hypothetical protein pEaSNUABM44_00161 [Erwinia phage pEa_SNUABM_44]
MLKDLEFSGLEVISATKNINDYDTEKDFIIAITMVRNEDSYSHLTGIEKLIHETNLQNDNKYIKLSCTYRTNDKGQIVLPIKIAYNGSTEKYSKRAYYDRDLTPDLFEDIAFIDDFFERTPTEIKRLYM